MSFIWKFRRTEFFYGVNGFLLTNLSVIPKLKCFPPSSFSSKFFLLNSVSQHERSLFSLSFHIHHLISQVAFPDICPRIFYCVVVGGEVYCGGRQPGGSGWWSRIGEGLMWLKVRRAFQSDPQYRSVAWLCVFHVCIFSYDEELNDLLEKTWFVFTSANSSWTF